MVEIDGKAKERAQRLGMPPDVHIPIGARDINAVTKYIGNITGIENVDPTKAFIVTPAYYPVINNKLPLWKLSEAAILHSSKQIWVHVNYRSYRHAYIKACPEENVKDLFIDHILNRRVARLKGFEFVRVIPVLREVNTSSGVVTEKYGFNHHSTDRMKGLNKEDQAFIEYADIADVVKMLNRKIGNKFQYGIRDSLYLLEE
jgi:Lhr-like helicase